MQETKEHDGRGHKKKRDGIGIYKTLCEVWGIGGDPVFRKGPRRKGYLTAVMSETSGITGEGKDEEGVG